MENITKILLSSKFLGITFKIVKDNYIATDYPTGISASPGLLEFLLHNILDKNFDAYF